MVPPPNGVAASWHHYLRRWGGFQEFWQNTAMCNELEQQRSNYALERTVIQRGFGGGPCAAAQRGR
jgi:hypothetical protein